MTPDPIPPSFNMAAYVLGRAKAQPDKIALAVLGPSRAERWSYARLEAAVRGTATGLREAGLKPGEKVMLRLGNTPDFPICFLACLAVDIVPVPTSAQLTAPEATKLAELLCPAAIIAGEDVALPGHTTQVITTQTIHSFHDLPPAEYIMGDPNRLGYIIFTSGTSGTPRGVMHAHRAVWARRMMWQGWYGLTEEDRVLHAGAFNWTYTLGTGLMDPWSIGATALIPQDGTAPALLPLLMKRHDATIFAAAPGVYRQLLKSSIPTLPKLRHGLSAGEKLPEVTRARWQAATGTVLHEAYGMSECSTFISGSPDRPAELETLGRPQPGRRIALLNEGTESDTGQIAIHKGDPGLMLGYLGAPEETAKRFADDWFLTGDIGSCTATGDIRYEGRADDMMNAGGFRVSPIEVEAVLTTHPEIQEVAAVELCVKSDATVIAAFYVSEDVIEEEDLVAHCDGRLARYKTPRMFIRTPALPRGANNKLLRRKLKEDWNATNGET